MFFYRLYQWFSENNVYDERFFRVAISIEDQNRNTIELRTSIKTDDSDDYRDWFNLHWEIKNQAVGQMAALLKLAAKIGEKLQYCAGSPLEIINIIEGIGVKPVFFASTKFGTCGYTSTPYFACDLHKKVITVSDDKNGLIISYVGSESDYEKEMKKRGFNNLSKLGGLSIISQPLETSDFERTFKLIEKIRSIKTWKNQ